MCFFLSPPAACVSDVCVCVCVCVCVYVCVCASVCVQEWYTHHTWLYLLKNSQSILHFSVISFFTLSFCILHNLIITVSELLSFASTPLQCWMLCCPGNYIQPSSIEWPGHGNGTKLLRCSQYFLSYFFVSFRFKYIYIVAMWIWCTSSMSRQQRYWQKRLGAVMALSYWNGKEIRVQFRHDIFICFITWQHWFYVTDSS